MEQYTSNNEKKHPQKNTPIIKMSIKTKIINILAYSYLRKK